MADIGLWRQAVWRWVQSQKMALAGAHIAVECAKWLLSFLVDRYWPVVHRAGACSVRLLNSLLAHWHGCAVRGFRSLVGFGPAAVFMVLWNCFICLSSVKCGFFALISLEAAWAVIHYLGYTSGVLISGFFGILIVWMNGYFWITGGLLVAGGYVCSLKHSNLLILVLAVYSVYSTFIYIGWVGNFLAIGVSFVSNDLLDELLEANDEGANKSRIFEEQNDLEPAVDEAYGSFQQSEPPPPAHSAAHSEPPPRSEPENVSSAKAFCSTPTASISRAHKEPPVSSEVVKVDTVSQDEMKRIMRGSTHYEVLGVSQNRAIDVKLLKKDYRKKVLLVHPDKNMGIPLACESFKRLQCAYEVLSDPGKRRDYDEQLRREEFKGAQSNRGVRQQNGVEFRSEESRRIECTKCGNFHIWICTRRSKLQARWCQDCRSYHPARDGEGWIENGCSPLYSSSQKVDIPRAFVCAESKIFDVSEWAICQGMECKPNTHRASFMVNMVSLDRTSPRSYSARYPWTLDAHMVPDDEIELLFQQDLAASGVFAGSPKRRKSWSPFKLPHKGMRYWRRSSP